MVFALLTETPISSSKALVNSPREVVFPFMTYRDCFPSFFIRQYDPLAVSICTAAEVFPLWIISPSGSSPVRAYLSALMTLVLPAPFGAARTVTLSLNSQTFLPGIPIKSMVCSFSIFMCFLLIFGSQAVALRPVCVLTIAVITSAICSADIPQLTE